MKVLIVDDQPMSLKVLRKVFEAEGYTVLGAPDGVEALSILGSYPVDAIISDILMPHMDGFRFCAEVRQNARLRSIPFIFYTATYNSPADEKLGYDLGANKYITKPTTPKMILSALR